MENLEAEGADEQVTVAKAGWWVALLQGTAGADQMTYPARAGRFPPHCCKDPFLGEANLSSGLGLVTRGLA